MNITAGSFRGQRFTFLVMLKMLSEMDPLAKHLPHLRCGHPFDLRSCRVDEDAMLMQAGNRCAGSLRGVVAGLVRDSGCYAR